MKRYLMFVLTLTCATSFAASVTRDDLQNETKRRSYGLGANYGNLLRKQSIEVDPEVFGEGLKDALASEALLSDSEIKAEIRKIQSEIRKRSQKQRDQLAEENKKKGEAFLAENKKKEGVVTLPSGLQYQVLKKGDGPKPTATDSVRVHYRGTLIDGTEFDSSYARGRPANFNVTGVIRGWTEALELMNVGSKWKLFVPADLAYGKRGSGKRIGPNQTLLFEVELIEITTPKSSKTSSGKPVTSDIIKVPSADELKKGAKIEIIKADEVNKYIKKEKTNQKEDGTQKKEKTADH